jgi:hypothetical protein
MTTAYPDQPAGPDDQPVPGQEPTPAAPGGPEAEPGREAPDQPDTGDDDDENPAGAPLGSAGTYELAMIGERLGILGRSARNQFGDRIVIIAEQVRDLAHEARRRLTADRLPDDAGTPEQRDRRDDERQRHPTARAGDVDDRVGQFG